MAELTPERDCDREVFREVIGHFMTGVTVITTSADGKDHGMAASAVSSLSLDPPMLLACLNDRSPTQAAITRSGRFCVNVLADDQDELALQFARPSPDKFAGVATRRGALDVPILADALASLECRVEEDVTGGTHRVFLARVKRAQARDGSPLAYFRGSFGSVRMAADAHAYQTLRALVLTRELPLGAPLDVAGLAGRLELRRVQVYHALLKLEAEGLLRRDADGELELTAIDGAASDDAFDARCAIEIGVAELTVGHVTAAEITGLRRRMEATNGLIAGGRFTDVPAYVEANAAFHEHMVALAGSQALLDAYRRLSIPTIMARLFTRHDEARDELIDDHRRLVEAYEEGDVAAARAVIRSHSEHAKATNNAAIAAGGGRV